ncbi:MAG: glyoxalase I [Candidatus Izimaplasma bacterium HR2]|nr:MAG: glyoxalase I [Candidatus Izimaplasma bacterium HR2]
MNKIEHISLWVKDLEKMRTFYSKYFNTKSSDKYVNKNKQFSSYFLNFEGGSRIEIMEMPHIFDVEEISRKYYGYCHLAISVGSRNKVIELTELIRKEGYRVTGEPRETGDGYFESVILDPEGNRIEITI